MKADSHGKNHWIPLEIKQLAQSVYVFFKADFNPVAYGYTAVWLAIAASVNYYYQFDDLYLEPMTGSWQGILSYFLFYGTAWFSIALPLLWFSSQRSVLSKPQFWLRSLVFVAIVGIDGGKSNASDWLDYLSGEEVSYWIKRVCSKFESIAVWFTVCYLFMKWNEPELKDGLYGIRLKAEDLRPFVSMLWVMVPLIAAASFLPDFQQQYPVYKKIVDYLPFHGTAHWLGQILYEIAYLSSFIPVELMFRGTLVIGMSSLLGRRAVLPMVSIYMFLHFGKPVGEAISSVFGGYILGVLAFQNRNIWGGIFIHTCVAFLMDLAATLQHWLGNTPR